MRQFLASITTVLCIIGSPALLQAEERLPGEGTLLVGGRTYNLSHVVAYQTRPSDESLITVLASDRNLPIEQIKAALRGDDQSDDELSLSQPYVKVVFRKSGEVQYCQAWADNSSFSTSGDELSGELRTEANRVRGSASVSSLGDGKQHDRFALRFDLPLGLDGPRPMSQSVVPVKGTVSGKFTGDGKVAKLAYVSAHRREPFNDQPAIMLIFTEKDHAQDDRPDISAGFGDFGSALVISFGEDGSIFGCEVAHAAHAKKPFSSLGRIRMAEFDLGDRHVQGQITTDGEDDAFDQRWEVDLKFAAPLGAPTTKPSAPESSQEEEPSTPANPKRATAALNARDLPLPRDATDVEYKQIVEQMLFKSASTVRALAADWTKKLAEQGWTKEGADLITPSSAILNRARGEATLTVMMKPVGVGCQVTVFSTGLNWEEKPK